MGEDTDIVCRKLSVDLKDHFDEILKAKMDAIWLKFQSQETALNLAKEAAEKQYQHLNNLKHDYAEERIQFINRKEYEAKHDMLITLINALDRRQSAMESRLSYYIGGIAVVLFVLQFILPHFFGGK